MKRGFTLLEVCLAVAVMASGVLSVVVLYSMGFRETRQSREDVLSAAYADAVISPLVNALSATNLTWSAFQDLENYPKDRRGGKGWAEYYDDQGRIDANPESRAMGAYDAVMAKMPGTLKKSYPSNSERGGLKAGLIVMHDDGSAIVKIGFRATRTPAMLMSAPLYYTEVRFQGVPE